tara:strand:+ start:313 stop:414 length:102 start_codon:yes stop_codon:yes gene_type:complete
MKKQNHTFEDMKNINGIKSFLKKKKILKYNENK